MKGDRQHGATITAVMKAAQSEGDIQIKVSQCLHKEPRGVKINIEEKQMHRKE